MVAPLAVDLADLAELEILRVVERRCRQCGGHFEFAQLTPRCHALYCMECAAERRRQRLHRKEERRLQRMRADPRCMYRAEIEAVAVEHGHATMTVGRSVTCTRCWQVLGHRRGPAKSSTWFVEPAIAACCTRGR